MCGTTGVKCLHSLYYTISSPSLDYLYRRNGTPVQDTNTTCRRPFTLLTGVHVVPCPPIIGRPLCAACARFPGSANHKAHYAAPPGNNVMIVMVWPRLLPLPLYQHITAAYHRVYDCHLRAKCQQTRISCEPNAR